MARTSPSGRMSPEDAAAARRKVSEAFVAGSLEDLAAMLIHDGSDVPRWLQEGMMRDIDGTWPDWWREHSRRMSDGGPYSPNLLLVDAAREWSRRNGVKLD